MRSAVPAVPADGLVDVRLDDADLEDLVRGARARGVDSRRGEGAHGGAEEPAETRVPRRPRPRDEESGVQGREQERGEEDAAERGRAEKRRHVGERVREEIPREAAEDEDVRAESLLGDPGRGERGDDSGAGARPRRGVERRHEPERDRVDARRDREREPRENRSDPAEPVHRVRDPRDRDEPERAPEDPARKKRPPPRQARNRRKKRNQGDGEKRQEREIREAQRQQHAGGEREEKTGISLEGKRESMRRSCVSRSGCLQSSGSNRLGGEWGHSMRSIPAFTLVALVLASAPAAAQPTGARPAVTPSAVGQAPSADIQISYVQMERKSS